MGIGDRAKQKAGRPKLERHCAVCQDLEAIGITWEEVCHWCVPQSFARILETITEL